MSANIVTGKRLPRRIVLRGMGAAFALPWLEGMVPALARRASAATGPLLRLGAVYAPNGMNMGAWTPRTDGPLELSPTLQPLAPFRDQVVVVSGMANNAADQLPGEGSGDHSRSSAGFLTGAHAQKSEGSNMVVGVSMDQVAAKRFSNETQLASLELALESNDLTGACEHGYSCAYPGPIDWATANTALPMENNPRAVFERMFGASASTDPQVRLARIRTERSILDAVSNRLTEFKVGLSTVDRRKVTEFADSVRDIERRLQLAERQSDRELPAVDKPAGAPDTYAEYATLMFDLWAVAWQADLTRVTTWMFGREKSNRPYPEIGVVEPHHPLSHHNGRPASLEKLAKLNKFHVGLFARFLEKLAAVPDGDGSLLDHSMIVYGAGMSNSDMHHHQDVPLMVVGGGAGRIRGGRHIRVAEKDAPMANLHVTLLDKMGVPVERLGDSSGRVAVL